MDKQKFLAKYGSAEHVSKLLDSNASSNIKYLAAKNPSIDKTKIDQHLDSDDWTVHLGLSKNPSIEIEHLKKLANHKDSEIQTHALMHPKATREMVHDKINSQDKNALSATKENLFEFSPHVDDELCHKVMANKDEWPGVRRYAAQRLAYGKNSYENDEYYGD